MLEDPKQWWGSLVSPVQKKTSIVVYVGMFSDDRGSSQEGSPHAEQKHVFLEQNRLGMNRVLVGDLRLILGDRVVLGETIFRSLFATLV